MLTQTAIITRTNHLRTDISYHEDYYLPLWNTKLINVHYRHFARSLTYPHGLDSWMSLQRFSAYPPGEINWELTGLLLQPSDKLSASRLKRNLVALLLEELPTLSKLQIHKPNLYKDD